MLSIGAMPAWGKRHDDTKLSSNPSLQYGWGSWPTLSVAEIEAAVAIVKKEKGDALYYNTVTLWEPRKAEMMAWLEAPETAPRPHRVADVVAIGRGSKVFDGTVDLTESKMMDWTQMEGVQPMVCMVALLLEPRT